MNVGILDYGGGNLRSVLNAFAAVGIEAHFVRQPDQFQSLDLLVFPGQGAFGDSVKQLKATQLWEPLKAWLEQKKPYFGICLGYQLLFESSEESPGIEGLGIFKGKVVRFAESPGIKIPHMGWNEVTFTHPDGSLWEGLGGSETYYFVHSYYPQPVDSSIVACHTDYIGDFASGVESDNLVAVQFHPEKSQQAGLALITNVVNAFSAAKSV